MCYGTASSLYYTNIEPQLISFLFNRFLKEFLFGGNRLNISSVTNMTEIENASGKNKLWWNQMPVAVGLNY